MPSNLPAAKAMLRGPKETELISAKVWFFTVTPPTTTVSWSNVPSQGPEPYCTLKMVPFFTYVDDLLWS